VKENQACKTHPRTVSPSRYSIASEGLIEIEILHLLQWVDSIDTLDMNAGNIQAMPDKISKNATLERPACF